MNGQPYSAHRELRLLRQRYEKLEAWAMMRDAGHDDLRKRLNAANAEISRLRALNSQRSTLNA